MHIYTYMYLSLSLSLSFPQESIPDVGFKSGIESGFESNSIEWGGVERAWFEDEDSPSISVGLNGFFLFKFAFLASCLKFSFFLET